MAVGAAAASSGGYGLPFAYDPLWRYQTINPVNARRCYLDPGRPDRPRGPIRGGIIRDRNDVGLITAAGPVGQRPRQRPWLAAAHELQHGLCAVHALGHAVRAGIPSTSSLPRTWSGKRPPTRNYTVAVPGRRRGHAQHRGPRPEHQPRTRQGHTDVSAHQRLAVLLDDHGPAEQHGQRRRVRGEHRRL